MIDAARDPIARAWWNRPPVLVLVALLTAAPLFWPDIPPLVDLPGHMARYRVQLDLDRSPWLQAYYGFDWALLGNLGVDLLVMPLAPLIGLERAVKLIALLIPPLTAAGMLWTAREAHGRLPATAFFALPLIWGYPFHFGFINFALSIALAFNAFALWLRLGRTGRLRLRAALFVPVGMIIWVTHSFGWGVLGLLAFAAEFVRQREAGRSLIAAACRGGLGCLPLAPPLLLMLAWRSGGVAGQTTDWFNWAAKTTYLISALRDHWHALDLASLALLFGLLLLGLGRWGVARDRTLVTGAAILLLVYLLLPRILLGSAYGDMRLAPYMISVAVLALRPSAAAGRAAGLWAAAGLAFLGLRLGVTTANFVRVDRVFDEQLSALDRLPRGARVFSLIALPCHSHWDSPRTDHLEAMATVRRDAFTNGHWVMPGAQLLTIRYAGAPGFDRDPSQILRPPHCQDGLFRYPQVLARFPRAAYDYLWLIDFPRARLPQGDPGLVPVWRGRTGALYRLPGSATSASDTPNGSERRATQ